MQKEVSYITTQKSLVPASLY